MANPWLVGASLSAPLIGGIFGASQADKDRRRQDQLLQQALAEYAGLTVPDIEQMKLNLATPEYIGDYDPVLQQLVQMGPSAMEGISTDPRLAQAQMQALEQMAGIADAGGMTAADKAMFDLSRRNAAAEAQAKQGQILQNMQARGIAGGGAELIAKLKAGQSAADRMSAEGMQAQITAQERALQAIRDKGSLASQLRGQQFNEKSAEAQAKDAISRFNAGLRQQTGAANVGAQNQAALRNLQTRQDLANQQANIRNQQQQFNKGLYQQDYQNRLGLANARAGVYTGQSDRAGQRAGQTAGMWSRVGQGLGQIGAGLASPKKNTTQVVDPDNPYGWDLG